MGSTANFARGANCDAGFKLAMVDAIACEPSSGLKVGASSKHAADLDALEGVTKGWHLRTSADKS
jgi:hypothetical protein